MRNFSWICFVAFLFASTREARSELDTFVKAAAYEAESGQGEFNTASLYTSATFSNPNGGSASASASVGPVLEEPTGDAPPKTHLAMKAFATATGGSGESRFVGNQATASVFWDEVMTFHEDTEFPGQGPLKEVLHYVKFVFHADGSESGDTHARFEFALTNPQDGESIILNHSLVATSQDVPVLLLKEDLNILESVSLHVGFSLKIAATGHGTGFGNQGFPNSSTADYGHTIKLMSIGAYDANGNVIPGVTIQSESGFDYNPAIVPEPLSATLAATGLVCISFASRLTRRKRDTKTASCAHGTGGDC